MESRIYLSVIVDSDVHGAVYFRGTDASEIVVLRESRLDGLLEFSFDGVEFLRDVDPQTPGVQTIEAAEARVIVDLEGGYDRLEIHDLNNIKLMVLDNSFLTDAGDTDVGDPSIEILHAGVDEISVFEHGVETITVLDPVRSTSGDPADPTVIPDAGDSPVSIWLAPGHSVRGPPIETNATDTSAEDNRSHGALRAAELDAIVAEALWRWSRSPLARGHAIDLADVQVVIGDLPGLVLGQAKGHTIVIDPTAAGYGWFVDQTPWDDEEFDESGASIDGRSSGRFDLLTIVMHEFGHVLGLDDVYPGVNDGLMAGAFVLGQRLDPGTVPVEERFVAVFGSLVARNVVVDLTSDLHVDGDIFWDDQVIVHGSITVTATGTITLANTGSIVGDGSVGADDLILFASSAVIFRGGAGGAGLRNLEVRSSDEVRMIGASIVVDGTLTIWAESIVHTTVVESNVIVLIEDSLLGAASVSITARSDVTAETEGFQGGIGFDIASVEVESSATVRITGSTRIESAGFVDILAWSKVTASAEAFAWAGVPTPDAAIARSTVSSTAVAGLSGASVIVAAGLFRLRAIDDVEVLTLADGASASPAAVGGSWAESIIDASSEVFVIDSAAISAANIVVSASSIDDYMTTAISTSGGAIENGPLLLQALVNSGAATSDGPVSLAGALGVTEFSRVTTAYVSTVGILESTGTIVIDTSSLVRSATTATGAATQSSTGVGVAVSVNSGNVVTESYFDGDVTLIASAVDVRAGVPDGSDHAFSTKATSGAGAADVGVAGSVAINTVGNRAEALIKPGATVSVGGADFTLAAANRSSATANALASDDGATGSQVGFGLSFALNIAKNISRAEIRSGATLSGVADVTVRAVGSHVMATTVVAGGKSSGGVGIAGAVGVSIANNKTIARLRDGTKLTLDGSLTLSATHTGSTSTEVKGDTESALIGVGLSIAVTVANDFALATAERAIIAAGAVTFTAHSSGASSADATAGVAGGENEVDASGDVNGQVTNEMEHGDSVGTDALGSGGGIDSPLEDMAETSDGAVTVAGAVAVNRATSRARAFVPDGGSITAGEMMTLSASNNADASAKADGSTTGDASLGVGVAIAINTMHSDALAYIGSGATVSAVGIRIEAIMTDVNGDAMNSSNAESKSGAGSDKVGLAGSLAINVVGHRAQATVRSDATVSGGGSTVELIAVGSSSGTAKATTGDDGASGSTVGVGASVALNIAQNRSVAEVRSGAALSDAGDLLLSATGSNTLATEAEAGSASSSGVGVAGAVGMSIANNKTIARLKDGAKLIVGGSLTLSATHMGLTSTKAKGSTKAGTVGVGIGLALTVANDYALATSERELEAGGAVTFQAHSSGASSAEGTAAAEGAKDENSATENINQQIDTQLDHGDEVGTDNLGSNGGTNDAEAADAETSDGGVTVGAAVGVNIGVSRAHAYVPDGGIVSAGGMLTLSASNNTDASAKGDGSTTGDAAVGVGVGIALNVGTSETLAYIGTGAIVTASGVRAEALMTDVGGDTKSVFGAESTSGAGSENVGVAGSVAINITANRSEALIKSDASVVLGGGSVSLSSVNTSSSTAKALTKGLGATGSKVGVGASVALNVAFNLSRSEVGEGVTLSGAGDLSLTATGTHTMETEAAAGSKGKVAVSPAVAISIPVSRSEAMVRTKTGMTLGGGLTIASTLNDDVTTKAQGDANADGKGTGVGVSASLAVVVSTARSELHGSIGAQGDVSITADATVSSVVEGNASAIGAPDIPGTDVDQEISRQLAYGDTDIEPPSFDEALEEAGNANFEETGKTIATVGVAAAFSVNVVTTKAVAMILESVEVTTPGAVLVASTMMTDATAESFGSALINKNSIGVAVALNVTTVINRALVGNSARVEAGDVTVRALMTQDQTNDIKAEGSALGGGTGVGVAGSIGVNVIVLITEAKIGDDATVISQGTLSVQTGADHRVRAQAGVLAIGGKVGVGASIAVNVLVSLTGSSVGQRAQVSARGATMIDARTSVGAIDGDIPGDPMTIVAGGAGAGKAAVAGSASVNLLVEDTFAIIGDGATVNGVGVFGVDQHVVVKATSDTTMTDFAGAISASKSVGVGFGIDVVILVKTTEAVIGDSVSVSAGGDVIVRALANEEMFSFAGTVALAGTAGIGGSIGVLVVTTLITASIGDDSTITAGGNVLVEADHNAEIEVIAGTVAASGKAAGGIAIATLIKIDSTTATVGERSSVTAESNNGPISILTSTRDDNGARETREHSGLAVTATSFEDTLTIAVGVAIGLAVGINGSATVNVLVEETIASIGEGAVIRGAGVALLAADETDMLSIAGGIAGGGTAGVGASLDVGVVTKTTEAFMAATVDVQVSGDVSIEAASDDRILSIVANIAVGGSAGVGGVVSTYVLTTRTEAAVRGSAGKLTVVMAGGDFAVRADGFADIDQIAGAIGAGGSAGVGISNTTLVKTDVVEAFIGPDATIASRGSNGLSVIADSSEDVLAIAAGGGGSGTAGVAGSATVKVLVEITRAFIDTGTSVDATNVDTSVNPGVMIKAVDETTIIGIAGAVAGGGAAGVGAAIDVVVLVKSTEAFVSNDTETVADGNIEIRAESDERIVSVTASLAVGGSTGIAGTAGVSVLTIGTHAFIDHGFSIWAHAVVVADGSVAVSAVGRTEVDIVSGNVAGAGAAAIGAAASVPIIVKLTEAYIGRRAWVVAHGNGDPVVVNTGGFDVVFVADAESVSFDPAMVDDDTNSIQLTGGHTFVTGDAVNYDAGASSEPIGGLTEGRVYYVIADSDDLIRLASSRSDARAGIAIDLDPSAATGTNHTLSPDGEVGSTPPAPGNDFDDDGTEDTDDASFSDQRVATMATAEFRGVAVSAVSQDDVENIAITGGGAAAVAVNVGGSVHVIVNETTASIAERAIVTAEDDAERSSVLVTAGSDYYHLAIAGALSVAGTVSVAPAVDVVVVTNKTHASIAAAALVQASGDIAVIASAFEDMLVIAGGVAGSGLVSVAGSVPVVVLVTSTQADIGAASADPREATQVIAGGNVLVSAQDHTDVDMIAGSIGIGIGAVGVGASVGVAIIVKDTSATIGPFAVVDALGVGDALPDIFTGEMTANGFALGQSSGVAVQAYSSEDLLTIAIAGAFGFYAGVAGGITVEVINSDTTAAIGAMALINQRSDAADESQSVNVSAANDVKAFAVGGSAGVGIVGVGGGVDVGVIRNDVLATIGAGARVAAESDVDVNALARKDVNSVAVSAAGGVVGVAGSVSVWTIGTKVESSYSTGDASEDTLDNDVISFADDMANGDDAGHGYLGILEGYEDSPIDPATQVDSETDTIDFSGIGHGYAAGDPVVYSADGGDVIEGIQDGETYYIIVDDDDQNLIRLAETPEDAIDGIAIDLETVTTTGNAHRLDRVVGRSTADASSMIADGAPNDAAAEAVDAGDEPSGTAALIQPGAEVVAGGDVGVRAEDDVEFHAFVGAFSVGIGAFGAAIGIASIRGGTLAAVAPGASVSAGSEGELLVRAKTTGEAVGKSVAGEGGAVAVGAQVIVVNDRSSQVASIGDGAVIGRAGSVRVEALAERSVESGAVGVRVAAVAIGAAVTVASIGPSANGVGVEGVTLATIGSARLGAENDRVGDVTVFSRADDSVSSKTTVIGLGIGAITVNVGVAKAESASTVGASISGAVIYSDGDVLVRASNTPSAVAESNGVGAGSTALSFAFSNAVVGGTASALVGGAAHINTADGGTVKVVAESKGSSATAENFALTVGGTAGTISRADASVGVTVSAGVAGATIRSSGDVVIRGSYDPSATAYGNGVAAGIAAIGVTLSRALTMGSATATVTGGSVVTAGVGGSQSVGTGGIDLSAVRIVAEALNVSTTATSKATSGGAVAGVGADAEAESDISVSASVDGSMIEAAGYVKVRGQNEAKANAVARGNAGGLVAAGGAFADAIVNGTIGAGIVGGSTVTAGAGGMPGDVMVIARSNGSTADADSGAYGGGLVSGVGVIANASNTLSGDARVSDSVVTASRDVSVLARLVPKAHGEADGAAGGLAALGGAKSTAVVNVTSAARLGADTIVRAGTDSTPGDVLVHSRSESFARGKAGASTGGLAAGAGASASGTVTSDTQAWTGSRANVNASGSISIVSESINRVDVDVSGTAIGLAAAGGVKGTATLAPYTRSRIGVDSQLLAGQDIDVSAALDVPLLSAISTGGQGGLIGVGGQNVLAQIDGIWTIAAVGSGAILNAGGRVDVTSTAEIHAAADARQTAAGLITVNVVMARAKLLRGHTNVNLNSFATIEADDIRIAAVDADILARAHARSETTIAAYSESTSTALTDVYTDAHIEISDGVLIYGRKSVTVSALSEDVESRTNAIAKTLGFAGDSLAISDNDLHPKATNVYRAGSHIITNTFIIDSEAPHYAQNYERIAVAETKTVTKLVKVVVGSVCEWFFGLFGWEKLCEPLYDWIEEVLPSTEDKEFLGQKLVKNDIQIDGMVTITGPPSPYLEIDADGNVVRAENLRLLPGEPDQIVVDDIINQTGGTLRVNAPTGNVMGNPVFNLNSSFDDVTIINESDKNLVINDIRTLRDESIFTLIVSEQPDDFFNPTFNQNHTDLRITSTGQGVGGNDISLRGGIANPRGITSISTAGGNIIRDGLAAVIQTQVLALHASSGMIGSVGTPIFAEIISSTVANAMEPRIDAMFGANGVYLELTAVTEDGAPLGLVLNGISASHGDVVLRVNDALALEGEPLLELTLTDGSVITGQQLSDTINLNLVDGDANSIGYGFDHGLVTSVLDDDKLFYSSGDGDAIGGLVDGATYFIHVVDGRHIRLARSLLEAQESADTLFGGGDVGADSTIDLGYEHGYRTGDAVRYRSGGGDAIGGLVDGVTYYVIEIGDTTLALASSAELAASVIETVFDAANTGVGGAVDSELDTINFGTAHGFSTGDPVVYQTNGSTSIGGLINGEMYHVIVVDSTTIRLARSLEEAADDPVAYFDGVNDVFNFSDEIQLGYTHNYVGGDTVIYRDGGGASVGGLVDGQRYFIVGLGANSTRVALNATSEIFDPTGTVDSDVNSIDFGHAHGFTTGDEIVYDINGGAALGGLSDGATYYVIVLGASAIGLAASLDDATATSPILIDLDGAGAAGSAHRLLSDLRVQLDPSVASGTAHSLRIDLIPSGSAGAEHVLKSDARMSLDGSAATGTSHTLRIALDPSVATGNSHTLRGNVFYMQTDDGIVAVDQRHVQEKRRVRTVMSTPAASTVTVGDISSTLGGVNLHAGSTGDVRVDFTLVGLIEAEIGVVTIDTLFGDIIGVGNQQLIKAAHMLLLAMQGGIGQPGDSVAVHTDRLDAGATAGVHVRSVTGNLGIGLVHTTNGHIVIDIIDTAATDELVALLAGGQIIADNGWIELQVADAIAVADGYMIHGAGLVLIEGDRGNADPGIGATMLLAGAVISGNAILIRGGADDDKLSLVGASYIASKVRILGMSGNDTLYAGALGVMIEGGDGNDELFGGRDADRLLGGNGDDRIVGWAGNDIFIGGNGRDTADYSDSPGGVIASITGVGTDDGHGDQDTLSEIEVLIGSDYADILTGSSGSDEIRGGAGEDDIHTLAGDDLLDGGAGNDRIDGGDGVDTIVFYDVMSGVHVDLSIGQVVDDGWGDADSVVGVENIIGSQFRDRLIGDDADNNIVGGDENDRIEGGAGNDILFGGSGFDKIWGGDGDDTLDGGPGHDLIRGDEGIDTLVFTDVETGVFVVLAHMSVGNDGWGYRDVVFKIENVIGTAYDDEITGDRSANVIDGGAGNDQIDGRGGDDVLIGGAGDDTIRGGDGNDLIFGDAGNDLLQGGNGDDRLFGGDGDDELYGGPGNDLLQGGNGDDRLFGGDGDDELYGGPGNDYLDGGAGDDFVDGGPGDDVIVGGDGNDVLFGRVGQDMIDGGSGIDSIDGGDGNDIIQGGEGNDVIRGGIATMNLSAATVMMRYTVVRVTTGSTVEPGVMYCLVARAMTGSTVGTATTFSTATTATTRSKAEAVTISSMEASATTCSKGVSVTT